MSKPSNSGQDVSAIQGIAKQMVATGQQQDIEGAQLFNLGLPGLEASESYYGKLAGGDPNALARANAPAIQGITQATNSAKQNIVQNNSRGGERNLALEQADLSKGAQIGNLTTQSYTNAFPSLAQLGGQNVAQGTAATNAGTGALNMASNQYGNLLNINAQDKAATMGFLGSLAGGAAQVGAAGIKSTSGATTTGGGGDASDAAAGG